MTLYRKREAAMDTTLYKIEQEKRIGCVWSPELNKPHSVATMSQYTLSKWLECCQSDATGYNREFRSFAQQSL